MMKTTFKSAAFMVSGLLLFVFGQGCASLSKGSKKMEINDSLLGYLVYDPSEKKVVIEHDSNHLFVPASVSKIPAVLSALTILGPDYRFKTELKSVGKKSGSVFHGDLYLVGQGDPLLTASDLMSLVQALQSEGITEVNGNFYWDDSLFESQEGIDRVRNRTVPYNPGVSALSSEFNQFYVKKKNGEKNPSDHGSSFSPSSLGSIPALPLFKVDSIPGSDLQYESAMGLEIWGIPESLTNKSHEWRLPVRQASLFTSSLFRHLAKLEGIEIPEPKNHDAPKHAKTIAIHWSKSLVELGESSLEYSNNLIAELLQLAAAQKISQRQLDVAEAGEVITEWLKEQIPEQTWEGFQYENGSGLLANEMSAQQIVSILNWANDKKFGGHSFLSLLPISGWKGSLLHRLDSKTANFRVWAKTGGVDFSSSLAGYFYSKSGKKYLFAILCTDWEKRLALRGSPPTIAVSKEKEEEASLWGHEAQLRIDQMVESWIEKF